MLQFQLPEGHTGISFNGENLPVTAEGVFEVEDKFEDKVKKEIPDAVLVGYIPEEPVSPTEPPLNVDVPSVLLDGVVSGTANVGQSLTCTMGNWENEPTEYSYMWQSDGVQVGPDASDYLIAASDSGKNINCIVTAMNDIGSTDSPPSNSVAVL